MLQRRLGPVRATGVGLGAMLGAGLFVALGPASAQAGRWLVAAVLVAAVVAACNATSSARLAARHPTSGGTYVFAREELGPGWSSVAGLSFVVGKTASCAAMALAIGVHVAPGVAPAVAVGAVVALTALNLLGVHRSADVATVVAALVVAVVGFAAATLLSSPGEQGPAAPSGPPGVLAGAALLFFAFAGYARLATLGEEVRDPARTIPRAMTTGFVVVTTLYVLVAVAVTRALPADVLAGSDRAVVDALRAVGDDGLASAVSVVAVLAAGGALLTVLLGVSRTVLAMARDGRLPRVLTRTDARGVPWVAELTVAVVVVVALPLVGVADAVAVSSACVLVYYAVTNAAALALGGRTGRVVAAVGLGACLVLVVSLPLAAAIVAAGVVLLALVLDRVRT